MKKAVWQETSENTEYMFHCSEKYFFTVKIWKIKIQMLFHQYLFHQYFIYKYTVYTTYTMYTDYITYYNIIHQLMVQHQSSIRSLVNKKIKLCLHDETLSQWDPINTEVDKQLITISLDFDQHTLRN